MAKAIEHLKGEWLAQTGSTLQVEQAPQIDYAASTPPQADAIVVPSCQLAELAVRGWIGPLPPPQSGGPARARSSPGAEAAQAGVFSLLRAREAVWGDVAMAVPFGSPVLTLYYRADLLEKLAARPPRTWPEYQKTVQLLADRAKLGPGGPPEGSPWYPTLEPLGPGWAGIVLLARAAPYVTHRANYSTLFQIDTMEPLIDGPPFVRALEELVAAAGKNPAEQLSFDPGAVRRAFWAGQCGMALTWPSAADKTAPEPKTAFRLGLAELPGSTDVYNIGSQNWESRRAGEDPHVPLLGVAGRVGTLSLACPAPQTAHRLLLWLSDEQWNRHSSAVSPATTLFRQSDLRSPQAWTEKQVPPATAAEYALLTERTLSRQQWLFALRIPGRAEYLSALDAAVQQAVRAQLGPPEALRQVATRWREITNRLGLDRQRDAFRRSLGL